MRCIDVAKSPGQSEDASSTLHDHLYRSRFCAGVLVGRSDSRVALRKIRILATCPYYLVGNHIGRNDVPRRVHSSISGNP